MPVTDRHFLAFLSYRHADNAQEGRRWAEWLHRALERYVVPHDLVGTINLRGEPIPASLYPIFRDEDELPANADLATGIRAAMEVSDHLIVLCSPRSAISPWVRKEVREFKELGRSDRILAVMLAGEPNADDPAKAREGVLLEEECFCEELRYGVPKEDGSIDWTARTEPLAADLRPGGLRAEGFVNADAYRQHLTLNSALETEKIRNLAEAYHARLELGLLKVAAGLLGVPLSQLTERDAAHRAALAEKEAQRQREIAERERLNAARLQRRNSILMAAAAIVLLLALAAFWLGRVAEAERQRAEAALVKVAASEQAARAAKGRAVAAKKAADELISYMQYDLRDTLGKLGSLRMMEGINERIRRYHDEHPPEPGDEAAADAAERERSVALDERGDVQSAQGDLAAALQSYRDSLAIAQKLAQKDPGNAGWQRDLSISFELVGNVAKQQKRWSEVIEAFGRVVDISRSYLARANAEVAWLSVFTYGAGSCWEVLRDAPLEAVKLDRAQALADLRTARDRLRQRQQENHLVPPMDKYLPWIEGLLQAAEAPLVGKP